MVMYHGKNHNADNGFINPYGIGLMTIPYRETHTPFFDPQIHISGTAVQAQSKHT